jgi:membrane protein YdbS with pleckstrin-like domain
MYCESCGAQNSESARFCRKCGLELTGEEETRVAKRPADIPAAADEEATIFSISPTLVFVKLGYLLAALGAIMLVALVSILLPAIVPIWVAILLGLLLFLVPAFYHVRQKLVRYKLTPSNLEFDSGLISKTTRNVPVRRIQDVTVSATPWQRLLGFGDVIVDNASDEGGKAVLKNINSPREHADLLLKQIRRSDI